MESFSYASARTLDEMLSQLELEKLVKFANHVECSRLTLITPTSFPKADTMFVEAQARCNARFEWWEKKNLLDTFPSDRSTEPHNEQDEEARATAYFEKVVQSLNPR